jgi:hypothetical protein
LRLIKLVQEILDLRHHHMVGTAVSQFDSGPVLKC